jgi:hypothetical protein
VPLVIRVTLCVQTKAASVCYRTAAKAVILARTLAYKRTELPQPLASVNQKSLCKPSVPVSIILVKHYIDISLLSYCVLHLRVIASQAVAP